MGSLLANDRYRDVFCLRIKSIIRKIWGFPYPFLFGWCLCEDMMPELYQPSVFHQPWWKATEIKSQFSEDEALEEKKPDLWSIIEQLSTLNSAHWTVSTYFWAFCVCVIVPNKVRVWLRVVSFCLHALLSVSVFALWWRWSIWGMCVNMCVCFPGPLGIMKRENSWGVHARTPVYV